jgi:hypothetical protein
MKKTLSLLFVTLFIVQVSHSQTKVRDTAPHDTTSTIIISGKVLNLETNEPLGVRLFTYDLTDNHQVNSTVSDPHTGEFHLVVHVGQHYGLGAHTTGYLPVFEEFHLVEAIDEKEIERNFYMAPLVKGEVVPLTNVHFLKDGKKLKPLSFMALDELAEVMEKHPSMEIEIKALEHFGKAGYSEKHALNAGKAIIKYLRKKGVDKSRLSYSAVSETELHLPSDLQEVFEVELMIKEYKE